MNLIRLDLTSKQMIIMLFYLNLPGILVDFCEKHTDHR